MNQPSFYICNPDRRNEFAVETLILNKDDSRVVLKKPLHKEGINHLDQLVKTYEEISKIKNLTSRVNIISVITNDDGTVASQFVDGKSAERQLIDQVLSNDIHGALQTLQKVEDVIGAFKTSSINPTTNANYKNIFGNTYSREVECITPGLLDLNLDNFIVDNKSQEWHLFDYEWNFDCALPKDFLISRILFWFFAVRYKSIILLHSEKYKLIQIGENIFIPEYIYKKYEKYFLNLDEFLLAEWNFQKFTHKNLDNMPNDPQKNFGLNLYDKSVQPSQETISLAMLKLNPIKQLEDMQHKYSQLVETFAASEKQLNDITSSKAYKIARKMQQAKGRITGE